MWKDGSESVDGCVFSRFTVRIAESDRRRRLLSHMTSTRWARKDLGAPGPCGAIKTRGMAGRSAYCGPKLFFHVRSREVRYKIQVTNKRKEIQTKKKTKESERNKGK
jgi:hypothetical protein